MTHTCNFCDSIEVAEVVYEERLTMGRRKVVVAGLRKMECTNCGQEYVEVDQVTQNHALMESALNQSAGQVAIGLLRTIRERWQLTQRAASVLFGAGANSFAKWESGQLPSGPTALLLQCAANVPGTVEYLATLQKATLPSCPELLSWSNEDGEITGMTPVARIVPFLAPPKRSVEKTTIVPYEKNIVELYGEAA